LTLHTYCQVSYVNAFDLFVLMSVPDLEGQLMVVSSR
jgi:hypothetical protein